MAFSQVTIPNVKLQFDADFDGVDPAAIRESIRAHVDMVNQILQEQLGGSGGGHQLVIDDSAIDADQFTVEPYEF